jgi:DNA-binding NtrC family response regulator
MFVWKAQSDGRYTLTGGPVIISKETVEQQQPPVLRVLVVDDEAAMREVLATRLGKWGMTVRTAGDSGEALRILSEFAPHIVITDLVLPDLSGLELLKALLKADSGLSVVLMTAFGAVDNAVEAMKHGAKDFLTKPIDYDNLRALLSASEEELRRRQETNRLEADLEHDSGLGGLVGRSALMSSVYDLIRTLARNDASAVISGESGTGKELAARAIHGLSGRRDGPFVALNTAAIPEGLTEGELFGHEKGAFTGAVDSRKGIFEQADGGTLFLDEITEMPATLQPKFLRVLEEGKLRRVGGQREIAFDARIIAATNRNPQGAVDEGLLRSDLFFRLNVFAVEIPPLRERVEDLPLLTHHFVRQFNRKHETSVKGIREEAFERMRAHRWPGNVRELRNVVERAVILAKGGWIGTHDLPPGISGPAGGAPRGIVMPGETTVAEAERILILKTLEQVGNNKAEAARRLDIDVKTIRNKLKAYRAAGLQQ